MLCFRHGGREVRIAHVTLHASVAQALKPITRVRILRTLSAAEDALKKLGIATPWIAVSGVNPHAGEAGAYGREEIDIIDPAIQEARAAGMAVDGPIGADTLIQRHRRSRQGESRRDGGSDYTVSRSSTSRPRDP